MARRRLPNLKRRRSRREPKARIVIFCEGANTEPDYFNEFRRAYRGALIELEIIGPVGVPYTVAERAVERANDLGLAPRRQKKRDSFEEGDQVWAVFDRDEHPRFNDAVNVCEQGRVGVARSNPCFELWLILHEEDFDMLLDSHAVQRHLEILRPEYNRNGRKTPNCADLISRVEQAEERAARQLTRREDERLPYGPPSTTVGHLVRAILDAVKSAQ